MRSLTRAGLGPAVAAICLVGTLTGAAPGFDLATVPEPPADPAVRVLQLREWRSLTPPYERAELPEFTVYGGGRVVVGDSWDGALHRAREYTLAPDRYRQLYRLAHAAGLDRSRRLAEPRPATDGSLLVVSLWSGGRTHTTGLVTPDDADTGVRGRIVGIRRDLRALAGAAEPDRGIDYRPGRIAVLATGGGGGGPDDGTEAARPWPLAGLAAGMPTRMGNCTVFSGPAVPAVEALGRGSRLTSRWRQGEHAVTIALRPLLPDERGCADLDRQVP